MDSPKPPQAPRSAIAVVAAIYMVGLAFFLILTGWMLASAPQLSVAISDVFAEIIAELDPDAPPVERAPPDPTLTAVFTLTGLINIGIGTAFLAAGVGVFLRKGWARRLAIIVNGVYLGLIVVSFVTGGGVQALTLVLLACSAWVIYQFRSNPDVIAALSQ